MSVIAPFLPRSREPLPLRAGRMKDAPWPMPPAPVAAPEPLSADSCDWQMLAPALAMLGPVLHVDVRPAGASVHLPDQAPWPTRPELVGLACAMRVVASAQLDSDGPGECLHFLDVHDAPLASLWLLPDSDFLAWETLVERLHTVQMPGLAWQCGRCHASRGRARVRRFERIRVVGGELLDAAVPERLSAIGQTRARQLAQAAGASLLP